MEEQLRKIRLFAESVDQYGTWELFGGDGKPGVWNCSTWAVAALAFADVSPLPLFAVAPWFLPLNLDNSYLSLPDAEGWGAAAMNAAVYDHWQAATTWTPSPPRDPLAIDLDGDGLETVGVNTGRPVLFDHNADGLRTATGWVRGDDAWLVLDRDGNGLIDSGRELFGEDTVLRNADGTTRMARNGFDALRYLHANADSVFNAADPAFTQVRLWQDLNQDGISQPAELQTLQQQRITAIMLNPAGGSTALGNGNSIVGRADVLREGTLGSLLAADLQLAQNGFHRDFTDNIALTQQALALPEMGGIRSGPRRVRETFPAVARPVDEASAER